MNNLQHTKHNMDTNKYPLYDDLKVLSKEVTFDIDEFRRLLECTDITEREILYSLILHHKIITNNKDFAVTVANNGPGVTVYFKSLPHDLTQILYSYLLTK